MSALPALRAVDAYPMEHEGEQYFCLYDPTHMVEEQVLLTPPGIFIASHLDGTHSVNDVLQAVEREFSDATVEEAQIIEIVKVLDTKGFLQTDAYEAIRERVDREFQESPTRPAYHAGKSYPGEPEQLREFFDQQFLREGGPGMVPKVKDTEGPLPGAVIPHIDYQRGGHVYAQGYAALAKAGRPDTVIIFGVAHAAEPVPFILSRKGYETPFGTVETDQEWLEQVESACAWDPYEFELTHRTEHSIEFHASMLAYLYGTDVKIVPILCSMFGSDLEAESPANEEPIARFLEACRVACADSDKRISVIASADLAHVGKCFGDDFAIDETVMKQIQERDDEDLLHIEGNDPDRWYASVMKDQNARRVCGINCVYSALKTLDGGISKGTLVGYDSAEDPSGGVVSFASLTLE